MDEQVLILSLTTGSGDYPYVSPYRFRILPLRDIFVQTSTKLSSLSSYQAASLPMLQTTGCRSFYAEVEFSVLIHMVKWVHSKHAYCYV
jgi:hypothetical protein